MRSTLFAALALLTGCAAQPGPAPGPVNAGPAAVPDQVWLGTLNCGIIPNVLRLALVQNFRLDVRGGVARYQRNIRVNDTSIDTNDIERGESPVSADGRVQLRGQGSRPGGSYRAEYDGILPPGGGGARLVGVQRWTFTQHPPYDRQCQITLHRES